MPTERNTGNFFLGNAPNWALPGKSLPPSNPLAAFRSWWGRHSPPPPRFFRSRFFWQLVLAAGMLATGVFFLRHQGVEAVQIVRLLDGVHPAYLGLGLLLTGLYLLCQGWMYVYSFAALGKKVPLGAATALFLKRNFVSVFLPAGAFSSLAFFTRDLTSCGLTKVQIHLASFVFALCSLISVVVVAVPALLYSLLQGSLNGVEVLAFGFLLLLTGGLAWGARSLLGRGYVYRQLLQRRPALAATWEELEAQHVSRRKVIQTCLVSVGIELIGVAHLYIAMPALGFAPSLPAAFIGYIVMVLLLIASPVLRGLGAIEASVAYVLLHFGFPLAAAAAVTLLFRFFEFWLPLGAGLVALVARRDNVLLRVFPALLTCLLGVMNVLSTITPAGPASARLLREIIPVGLIHASGSLVLGSGILLVILSVYLLRGSRNAWWITVALTAFSLVLNGLIANAYAEALVGMAVLGTLLYTRRQYAFRGSPRYTFLGVNTLACSLVGVFLYGVLGFYLLDERHFGTHFTWHESVRSLMRICFLFNDDHLTPLTPYGRGFLHSLYAGSIGTMAFTAYFFLKPFVHQPVHNAEEYQKARALVQRYGKSALDYFKTYFDKYIFFSQSTDAFVAYRVAQGYAVVLEDPVCASPQVLPVVIREFDDFCLRNGLRSLYYRVGQESLPAYESLGKKKLLIGQEAIVDLTAFSIEAKELKSIRNALRKVEKEGYRLKVYEAPLKEGLLQKLASVSDEWLRESGRKEIIFAQGLFDREYVRQTTVLAVENAEEKIVGFLNLIPDYAPGEGTYDLIRKTIDAPNGIPDYLLIHLFDYLKGKGCRSVNLGLVPLAGLEQAQNVPERTLKFASQNLKSFAHYKGLREYKNKFKPAWTNKYLVFTHDLDLLQLPVVLARVSRV